MTSITVSAILVASIALLICLFGVINRLSKQKKERRLINLFNKTGEEMGLAFSSQELLRNKIIGLDGINRKFIVVNDNEKRRVINLNSVKRCGVEKSFSTYSRNGRRSESDIFATSISLSFHFKDDRKTETVIFYDHLVHPYAEQKGLENKARNWETILSKMVSDFERVRA